MNSGDTYLQKNHHRIITTNSIWEYNLKYNAQFFEMLMAIVISSRKRDKSIPIQSQYSCNLFDEEKPTCNPFFIVLFWTWFLIIFKQIAQAGFINIGMRFLHSVTVWCYSKLLYWNLAMMNTSTCASNFAIFPDREAHWSFRRRIISMRTLNGLRPQCGTSLARCTANPHFMTLKGQSMAFGMAPASSSLESSSANQWARGTYLPVILFPAPNHIADPR